MQLREAVSGRGGEESRPRLPRVPHRENTVTGEKTNTGPARPAATSAALDTDVGLLQAISLGRALATNGGDRDLKAVQLNGYPETLSSGARVLIPGKEANEAVLTASRE